MYNQQYKKIPEYERHIRNEEEYRDAIRNLRKGERFRIEDLMERTDVNFNEEQFTPFDFAYTVNALKNDYNISERPEQYMQMAKDYLHNDSFPERGGERAYTDAQQRAKRYYNTYESYNRRGYNERNSFRDRDNDSRYNE